MRYHAATLDYLLDLIVRQLHLSRRGCEHGRKGRRFVNPYRE